MAAIDPALSPTATPLLLVRHAETTDNVAMRLSGWTDSDLSEQGERQARLLAEHVATAHRGLCALYTSPLLRARRTAERMGSLLGLPPVTLPNLREIYFGQLDGRPLEEIEQEYASLLRANEDSSTDDFVWPEGESRSGFHRRVLEAMSYIARRHPGAPVAVVTHGGVVATFLAAVHHESPSQWRRWVVPNASLTEVLWDPLTQSGALLRHGGAEHLRELTEQEIG